MQNLNLSKGQRSKSCHAFLLEDIQIEDLTQVSCHAYIYSESARSAIWTNCSRVCKLLLLSDFNFVLFCRRLVWEGRQPGGCAD